MTTIKLSKLKPNPANPRFVKDDAFQRMLATMEKYPKFLEKRPIVIDSWDNPIILAGNVRFKALKALKYKEIPSEWVKEATDLSEEEKRAFMVLDNTNAGQWDFDTLANDWDIPELESFGVFIPNLNDPEAEDDQEGAFTKSSGGATPPSDEDAFNDEGVTYKNQYGVIVMCADEAQQQEIFERLTKEGLNCKIVVT